MITSDHGPRPIRWLGSRTIAAQGDFAPVVIGRGALGNDQELVVSPNHRIVVSGWQAEVLFGKAEVMVPAKSLLNGDTIHTRNGGDVEYFHLMFDRHQVIYANGVATESFHPGVKGADLATEGARREILALFPHLGGDFANYGPPARVAVSGAELSLLA